MARTVPMANAASAVSVRLPSRASPCFGDGGLRLAETAARNGRVGGAEVRPDDRRIVPPLVRCALGDAFTEIQRDETVGDPEQQRYVVFDHEQRRPCGLTNAQQERPERLGFALCDP